jgi:hypothetical protein
VARPALALLGVWGKLAPARLAVRVLLSVANRPAGEFQPQSDVCVLDPVIPLPLKSEADV